MVQQEYPRDSALSSIELPAKLKGARVMKGISQREMADALGLETVRAVRNIENGSTQDPGKHVEKWARRCGIPIGWFYGEVA